MCIMYTDFLWNYLNENGCKTVFIVTGGYSMYLHDSLYRNGKFNIIACHHEQSAIYAAIGYSKLNKDTPIVCVTSGCGITNTITGIVDCWQDSVPVLILCGQSNSSETIHYNSEYSGRNFSGQDVNIELLTKSITKCSKQVNNVHDAVAVLYESFASIHSGRKGPAMICIPLDVQRASVEYTTVNAVTNIKANALTIENINEIENTINSSKRPIIIAGNGIKLSDTKDKFIQFIKKYKIPVVTTFLGTDLISYDNELYVGKVGIMAKRNGNFALRNCDLLISLGSRLPISVVGYQYKLFGKNHKTLVIDIDKNEHLKKPYTVDYIYECDLAHFFDINFKIHTNFDEWLNRCNLWKKMWENEMPSLEQNEVMNPYHVVNKFNEHINPEIKYNILTNGGNNFYITWQTLRITNNINFLTSASQGDLGWELPASIGAYLCNKQPTICFSGDGSFQFNIQEMQTINHHRIPILIIIMNNNTYGAIEVTQKTYFKRYVGINKESGISFPSFKNIAETYGCDYMLINKYDQISEIFKNPKIFKEPILCEIIITNQERYPKNSTFTSENGEILSLPLEDMYPFLSKEIIHAEMINPINENVLKRLASV